jgi:hypothetical protein
MAKKLKEVSPSLLDFGEENLLASQDLSNTDDVEDTEELEGNEPEVEEEEEIEVPKPQPKKKDAATVAPKKKEVKKEEPPIEEEEEEDSPEDPEQSEEEDEAQDQQQFWQEVSKITGVELEVEYGEIDPLSPQGVAMREKALGEKVIDDFLGRLEEEYPAVYQALQYAHAGGDVRELYQEDKDYSKIVIQDDDEDHAKLVLSDYYQRKGFNEARAKRMIAADGESEEGLVATAKAALAEMVEEQTADRQSKLEEKQRAAQAQRQADQKFLTSISSLIESGKLDSFRIPDKKEAAQFMQHLRGSIQRDGQGGYLLVTPVDSTKLEKQLQAEYFKFKGGDLSKLITVKAETENTKKLRLRLQAQEKTPKSTTTPKAAFGSMRDLEV